MTIYTAPVEEMMFLFNNLRDNKNYNELDKYKEINSELVKDILEQAAKINQEIILPLARIGDENPRRAFWMFCFTPHQYSLNFWVHIKMRHNYKLFLDQ